MAGGGGLKARWQAWSARFAALQPREKYLVVGALGFVILFGGYSFWIEPAQLHKARIRKALAQQITEQEQLRAQVMGLTVQSGDPDAANREALGKLHGQLADAERDLKVFDRTLVTPQQAPALLQTLLTRHRGLNLVSLTTLAPQPLVEPPAPKTGAGKEKAPGGADVPAPLPGGNLYKHGIEIKLTGGYLDLLAYVSELEAGPQKLLWGGLRFDAGKYPVVEMTLTVYSLSLDATWLMV
jgi:MSHA biogenesis protein MshJ